MSDSRSPAMQQHNADRDALNAEKAALLGMIVAGKITAAEAAARLQDIKSRPKGARV